MAKVETSNHKVEAFQFIKLTVVSEILKISIETLLQLGAQGRLEISAAVLAEGQYLWPGNRKAPVNSVMHLNEFRVDLGSGDRVVLSAYDVSCIEAAGWVIPKYVFTPEDTKIMLENVKKKPSKIAKLRAKHGLMPIDKFSDWENTPWRGIMDVNENTHKTTLDHLFLSQKEYGRLKDRNLLEENVGPSSAQSKFKEDKDIHGNTKRFAALREPILRAAIYCIKKSPDGCGNATDWARCIEENINDLFGSEGISYSPRSIEDLLRAAIKGEMYPKA